MMSGTKTPVTCPIIAQGYRPGLIGQIVALHAETYSHWAGFGRAFECKVASELADFNREHDGQDSAIWHATLEGQLLGSIAIDGQDLGERRAHLRWFIVDPSYRGTGLGKQLLARALNFVDEQQFAETHLWTLKGLEAARALYERKGFTLVQEYEGDQWGVRITEQRWVRERGVS